jgi:hypothetical protein
VIIFTNNFNLIKSNTQNGLNKLANFPLRCIPRNKRLLEDLVVLVGGGVGRLLGQLVEPLLHPLEGNVQIHNEIKQCPDTQHGDLLLFEEVSDVGAVLAEKVERMRVVVLDRLGHVDDVHVALVVQHVELAEVGVHQFARVVQLPHEFDHLSVHLAVLAAAQLHVLQLGRRPAVRAEELHQQHVAPQKQGARRTHAARLQAHQVPHLLLGPRAHHFAGVAAAVAVPESKLAAHVFVTVLQIFFFYYFEKKYGFLI